MRREFGIKARHMANLEEDSTSQQKRPHGPQYGFAVFSDTPGRIIGFLEPLLAKHKKLFEFHGFDLYRKGLDFAQTRQGKRVVALVLADGPEDCRRPSEEGIAFWKETVIHYSESYLEHFIDEIVEDHVPAILTIVLLFHEKAGILTPDDLQELEKEFLESSPGKPALDVRECESEEEVAGVIQDQFVKRILKRHNVSLKMKEKKKSRRRRIVKATKVTKEASRRPR